MSALGLGRVQNPERVERVEQSVDGSRLISRNSGGPELRAIPFGANLARFIILGEQGVVKKGVWRHPVR
jgi:hypothetical protein